MAEINLSNITFVIPSNHKYVKTLESIPKESKVLIQREDTRGEARNRGVELATTEYICFCDDDIEFSKDFLKFAISLVNDKNIVGLEAYYPSMLIVSRLMILKKKTFENVGNLLPVQHGEETEFCIRAIEKGYSLVRLPRVSVYHYPHKKSIYKKEYLNLLWLIKLHPTFPLRIIKSILYKMKNSNYDDELTLPINNKCINDKV